MMVKIQKGYKIYTKIIVQENTLERSIFEEIRVEDRIILHKLSPRYLSRLVNKPRNFTKEKKLFNSDWSVRYVSQSSIFLYIFISIN